MVVKIKKLHKDAIIPKYAKDGDAGLDLIAVDLSLESIEDGILIYKTGLAVEIPKGYVGLIYPRSSISNYDLQLTNSVGVIDSGYRGNIMLKFTPTSPYYIDNQKLRYLNALNVTNEELNLYKIGDKIGQLIILPYPQIEFEEVKELSDTDRGEGGFGSTGN